MIKIVKAEHVTQYQIRLVFSDEKQGEYDLAPLIAKDTDLTRPLKKVENFKAFFLELGAICWKNGLELSASSIYRELQSANKLTASQAQAAA